MKVQTGGDLSTGSQWVDEAGSFHFRIISATEQPTKRDGSLIDNAAFSVGLEVLAGTNESQIGKTFDMLFFHPKPQDKNDGAFAKKKMDRFLLAANLANREQLEKPDAEIDADIEGTVDRQIIAKIELQEKDGKTRAQLSYAEIYHVDDSAVKSIPKSSDNLRLLPPEERWTGNRSQATQAAAKSAQPVASTAGDNKAASDDWDL